VGILGTTISPYLFFWQAAEEVEEERAKGKKTVAQRKGATAEELKDARTDTVVGMFFSNFIMYFIILTTGATLHAHGQTNITTAREAAEALRPLAGNGAYLLFTLGLIGTGMLGVPVLVGSSAYAVAEGAKWRGSMSDRPKKARAFYGVMAVAMVLGFALNYVGLNAVKMLFWSAVINGLLAPPLILLVILLTSNRKVMGKDVNSPVLRTLGWATFVVMTAAAAGMLITS
jgi:Mn2+/Fe2+ NRAMP family transporter